MKVWLSFEQEAVVSDCEDAPKGADPEGFDTGFLAFADASLFAGPGAQAPPGNVLAWLGPIPKERSEEAVEQAKRLLAALGHEPITEPGL